MTDSSASAKKTARTFDLQAMLEQARSGAQERSNVDWDDQIEKAKEENELRIAELKLKADEAARKMHLSTNQNNSNDTDDDDDDFGPSLNLATKSTTNDDDDNASSDDEEKNQLQVSESIECKKFEYPSVC